MEALQGEIASF